MKKILGLDLGVSSIGWAFIEENESDRKILGMGARIIPLSTDDKDEFTSGNTISKNQKRTLKRTQRKGYDRYQLRRENLRKALQEKDMLPDTDLINADKMIIWKLRNDAISEKIGLKEIGRVLLHINQKRGYKSTRSETNLDKKDTEYVAEVKNRFEKLREADETIGQHFFRELSADRYYRIKDQVFPREAYMEEFDKIVEKQRIFYPELFTKEFINKLRNEIIFYQRPLKSQKKLVSLCEFEKRLVETDDGQGNRVKKFKGPRVAHRSSPLFQVCRIWENINNIRIKDKYGKEYYIPLEKKWEIFTCLENHEKLTFKELLKILGLKKNEEWTGNSMLDNGIKGNTTRTRIAKCLGSDVSAADLLEFKAEIINDGESMDHIVHDTGEIITVFRKKIAEGIEKQPLYKLWHTIYSIKDENECSSALIKNFGIPKETADKLAVIDFTKEGYGNKSARAIRKILPFLMEGFKYSEACQFAGYNHSWSLTKEENQTREILDLLPMIEKNSLRQPVVEKILNQMINVVNAVIGEFGKPDEIKVELARELKQSREERQKTYKNINQRERENEVISKRLTEEYHQRATRNNILKWRLFHYVKGDDSKVNNICIYCGKAFSISDALSGAEVDIEHIIPRTLLFDDSENNKVLAHRKCNQDKGNLTAYDFMKTKGEIDFNEYIDRVTNLYNEKIINRIKRDRLMTPAEKIPKDFIQRQLRETQYISRKSIELLSRVCREVHPTNGTITEFLRRLWGWDDVLMNLQLPKYREAGLTELIEVEKNGQLHKKEVIKDWSKRLDHRHHAIDALTIACTKQGYIQRINSLSSDISREEMYKELSETDPRKAAWKTLLERYLADKQPFTTNEVKRMAERIMVSYKPGKKVATKGVRKINIHGKKKIVQRGITIPRGPLSEESVYGKIRITEKKKPVKFLFENPHLIFKDRIKKLVEERLARYKGNSKLAYASLKKEPLFIDNEKNVKLEYGTCFKEAFVIKYPLSSFKAKDIDSVVDDNIRQILRNRLAEYKGNEKEAFRDLENNPVWYDKEKRIPLKTIRCFTGLSSVEPVKYDENMKPVGYVKPGNNHHVAIYVDENEIKHEHVCTFWHAVERKKYGIPIIITNPRQVWDGIINQNKNLPESFLDKLPADNWKFITSLQQNEMFILGMNNEEAVQAIERNDTAFLSNYLYRVQKIAESNYYFRYHLETEVRDNEATKKTGKYYCIQSLKAFYNLNPIKVRVNCLGKFQLLDR
jgi:CRISPR-associated endonuclease Csn1